MTLANDIVRKIQHLPEPLQQEVEDFVEFLHSKHQPEIDGSAQGLLLELKGGLEKSPAFAREEREIQERLREEW